MPRSPVTVVLVDGQPVVCRLLRARLLADDRFEVLGHAGTAAAGVELVGANQPNVVVLDAGLPGVSGLSVIPRVLVCAPDTRIVVYSPFDDDTVEREAIVRGADYVADIDTKVDDIVVAIATLGQLGMPATAAVPLGTISLAARRAAAKAVHRPTAWKVAAGAACFSVVATGMAAANVLPAPLQRPIEAVARSVGLPIGDSGIGSAGTDLASGSPRSAHTTTATHGSTGNGAAGAAGQNGGTGPGPGGTGTANPTHGGNVTLDLPGTPGGPGSATAGSGAGSANPGDPGSPTSGSGTTPAGGAPGSGPTPAAPGTPGSGTPGTPDGSTPASPGSPTPTTGPPASGTPGGSGPSPGSGSGSTPGGSGSPSPGSGSGSTPHGGSGKDTTTTTTTSTTLPHGGHGPSPK